MFIATGSSFSALELVHIIRTSHIIALLHISVERRVYIYDQNDGRFKNNMDAVDVTRFGERNES